MNVMSVSLLRLRNGDIALFYLRKNSAKMHSNDANMKDETKTWSEAVPYY